MSVFCQYAARRRVLRLTLSLVSLAFAALAAAPPATATGGSIAGRVENARTRKGLDQAALGLYRSGESFPFRYEQTLDDGSFRFDDVVPGLYALAAWREGFDGQLYEGVDFPDPAETAKLEEATLLLVSPDGALGNLTFRLAEWGQLQGRVVSETTGEPLADSGVAAYRVGEDIARFGASADADGRFRLALPAGDYHLVAWDSAGRSLLAGTDSGCPRYFSTGSLVCDFDRAATFTVESRRSSGIGTLALAELARLRGRVSLEEPGELPRANVFFYTRGGKFFGILYLEGPELAFEIEVPGRGGYYVEASSTYHANQLYAGVECPGGPDNVFAYQCPDPRLGTPIEVTPGEERDLDFALRLDRYPCQAGALRLCFLGGRFSVASTLGEHWLNGIRYTTQLTRDAGFLQSNGLPDLVKMIDACQDYGHYWFFAQGPYSYLHVRDRFAGITKTYTPGTESLFDLQAFATCDVPAAAPGPVPATPKDVAEPLCGGQPAPDALCLHGRFKVEAEWQTPGGRGVARPLAVDEATGALSFFGPHNVELVVRVLDYCQDTEPVWAFLAGGLTDVAVTLAVTDTATGQAKTYFSPLGHRFPPILDAFATCP